MGVGRPGTVIEIAADAVFMVKRRRLMGMVVFAGMVVGVAVCAAIGVVVRMGMLAAMVV